MKYSKKFKLECVRKYKGGEHIETPSNFKDRDCFMGQVRKWNHIYNSLGEYGLESHRPTLSFEERIELIKRVEAGESYKSVAFSVGIGDDLLRKWHKIFMEKGVDGLKSLKRGRRPMDKTKPKTVKDIEKMSDKEKAEYYKKLYEEKDAEAAYLKKLKALVQSKQDKK